MKKYDEMVPSKYDMNLDANNPYSWAMNQYLLTGGFKQMIEKEHKKINFGKNTEDSKKGLILEIDLEYPQKLHNMHNNYSLAASKINVTKGMLSNYCEETPHKYNINIVQVEKLVPTLKDKEEYVLHYRNLQLHLKIKKLKKIH